MQRTDFFLFSSSYAVDLHVPDRKRGKQLARNNVRASNGVLSFDARMYHAALALSGPGGIANLHSLTSSSSLSSSFMSSSSFSSQ